MWASMLVSRLGSILVGMLVSMFASIAVNLWLLTSSITLFRLYRRSQLCSVNIRCYRRAQIAATRPPWRLNVTRWRQVFVGRQSWTCFLSPFWRLEFWGGHSICGNSVHPSVPALRISFMTNTNTAIDIVLLYFTLHWYVIYLTTLFQHQWLTL